MDSNYHPPLPATLATLLAALRQLICLGATEEAADLASAYAHSRSKTQRGHDSILGRVRSAGFRHYGSHLITEADFRLRLTRGINPLEGSTGAIGRKVRTRFGHVGEITDIRGDHARVVDTGCRNAVWYTWVPVTDLIPS
jgi:hypothetical protein